MKAMSFRVKTLTQIYLTGLLLLVAGYTWKYNFFIGLGAFLFANYTSYLGLKNYKELILKNARRKPN